MHCEAIEDGYQIIYEATESLENIESICDTDHAQMLIRIFQGNLCENVFDVDVEFPGRECEKFVEGSAKEGLTTVLLYFLKVIREFSLRIAPINELLGKEDLTTLYLLQKVFIGPFMRRAIEFLLDSENERASFNRNTKLTFLIVFFVMLVIFYLILWLPAMSLIENKVIVCAMADKESKANVNASTNGDTTKCMTDYFLH
jgi:Na+-transporting methylmalonyl-CoA/oxaloacetate decarboxylase gamma subunit